MNSLNKVMLIGRLGKDPKSYYKNGELVGVSFSLATSYKYTDKHSNTQKEFTEWHRICIFNALSSVAEQYLKKGTQVYVEGKLQTRKYTDKVGNEQYMTEIVADTFIMLGNKTNPDKSDETPEATPAKTSDNQFEDIPF